MQTNLDSVCVNAYPKNNSKALKEKKIPLPPPSTQFPLITLKRLSNYFLDLKYKVQNN